MEIFANLLLGLDTACTFTNLAYCLAGVFLGTAIGVLPGLGPSATIAMLLPATFGLPPVSALIMLAGIFYGAQYGGSTTAILVNLPGEASSVVTALDGYQMARQGKAGRALATAAHRVVLRRHGLHPADRPVRAAAGRAGAEVRPGGIFLADGAWPDRLDRAGHGSLLHALGMIVLGLLLGLIGTDVNSGAQRFTFGIPELSDGINFVVVAMGMFGIGEIIANLEHEGRRGPTVTKVTGLMPTREDWQADRRPDPARHRPGFAARHPARRRRDAGVLRRLCAGKEAVEKRRPSSARAPSRASPAPEAANNAGAQMSFIPMLTLGIPSNPVMALMIGAMIIQGIQPGPSVMTEQPALFWGIIVSMWIGNLMLLVLNLPLIGLWVKMISVPYHLLYPMILVFCAIGVFSLNNDAVRRLSDGRSSASSATSSRSSTASRRRCCWASSWVR